MTDTPKIYVADLAAYNDGYLHGKWIDATQEVDDIWQEIKEMLKASPVEDSEEHAIHDYEGFSGYSVNEYDSIETVHAIACFIEEHGDLGGLLLEHWSGDLEQARASVEENYCSFISTIRLWRGTWSGVAMYLSCKLPMMKCMCSGITRFPTRPCIHPVTLQLWKISINLV